MLNAIYFDGRQAGGNAARLERLADQLVVLIDDQRRSYEWAQVQWPEPNGDQVRIADLPDGGSVQCLDTAAFDRWLSLNGQQTHWIAKGASQLRWVVFSIFAMGFLVLGMVFWGIPWLAVQSVPFIPPWVDSKMGDLALTALDDHWLKPSALPATQQTALREHFSQLVARQKDPSMPAYSLHFRGTGMGANAFALPGGKMVVTDELVQLVQGDQRVLSGVLAHELGHLHYRHGMQSMVQVSALSVLAGALLGDFSTLLAGVPVALGQAGYSRQAERQADAYSAHMLRVAGISPKVMTVLFEKLSQTSTPAIESPATPTSASSAANAPGEMEKKADALSKRIPMAFASHPADSERVAYFEEQAAQCKSCQ